MRFKFGQLLAILVMLSAAQGVFGQGGPPMITDDPGTPGNGKWENNFAFVFEHRNGETSFETPQLDLNYGVGEHVQLTLQTRPVILDRSGQGLIGGLGGTEAAVKWRYADEEKTGVDASLFPRVIFNIQESSGRRGLSEKGTRFQVPFEVAKSFGRWHADGEFGPLISTVGRSEWLYGVVGGFDLTKTTGLMAEVHADSRTNFTEPTVVLNFGLRHQLTEKRILIISMGREVHTPRDPLAFIGYFGVQFLY